MATQHFVRQSLTYSKSLNPPLDSGHLGPPKTHIAADLVSQYNARLYNARKDRVHGRLCIGFQA
jgi:hypothetical protein